MVVCRRVEDQEYDLPTGACVTCGKPVYIPHDLADESPQICIHCCAREHPDTVLFVGMHPDEFGNRSMPVGIQEVVDKDGGMWHRTGLWMNPQTALAIQE